MTSLVIFIFGLIWGSFLNVIAYRLIQEQSLGGRSKCPHCNHQLAWYDNIPIISWLVLRGKCRTCAQPISFLYPFIEFLTGVIFVLLYQSPFVPSTLAELHQANVIPDNLSAVRPEWIEGLCKAFKNPDLYCNKYIYLPSYFIFFSALIVTIRTDLEYMLISRYVTLFLVPVGIALSAFGFLPIGPLESTLCAVGGYILFYAIAKAFHFFTGREGVGEGDFDLMALIGAFTGLMGLWMTLLIGSVVGCVCTLLYLLFSGKERSTQIPFGPFLALGAIAYVLFAQQLLKLFSI